MTMIETECFNCMKTVSCKMTTIENDDNRKLGGVGVLEAIIGGDRGCRGCQGCIEGMERTLGNQGPEGV